MRQYPITARSAARKTGTTRYFTGKPCPHGHNTLRWTKTGRCVECDKDKRRRRAKLFSAWWKQQQSKQSVA